ncbi:MAG: hypothetical protein JWP87_2976 [Labilithrix sp.]|nr:hypothetical protein [Labilithrix sp.]
MSGQLPLFGEAPKGAGTEPDIVPRVTDDDRAIAARVPSWVRFGTSSWSFPGWTGLLWKGRHTDDELARSGLRAYAQHPLFRTVSIDRSYYGPLRAVDVASYAKQLDDAAALTPSLPPFRIVSKVWDEITTAVFPKHPRYGARAGEANPMFLDAGRFVSEVLEPYLPYARHFGPFVFELTPMPKGAFDDRTIATKLDAFLSALPPSFPWAVELRNEELMTPRWSDVLRAHGAAHVFTFWTAMPSLRAQLARHGRLSSRTLVARLMLPPFMRYAEKKAEYAPFDRLVAPQPDMRDDVLALLRAAEEADCTDAFILANNKAEGSAPLTVKALADRVARELT